MSSILSAADAAPAASRPRMDAAAGRLVGGRCEACGLGVWPLRPVCSRCGGPDIAAISLPVEGQLTTWSRCHVPVGDIEPPYVLGLVDFDGVNVFCHVRGDVDAVPVPVPVRLRIDPEERPPFWVELS